MNNKKGCQRPSTPILVTTQEVHCSWFQLNGEAHNMFIYTVHNAYELQAYINAKSSSPLVNCVCVYVLE